MKKGCTVEQATFCSSAHLTYVCWCFSLSCEDLLFPLHSLSAMSPVALWEHHDLWCLQWAMVQTDACFFSMWWWTETIKKKTSRGQMFYRNQTPQAKNKKQKHNKSNQDIMYIFLLLLLLMLSTYCWLKILEYKFETVASLIENTTERVCLTIHTE